MTTTLQNTTPLLGMNFNISGTPYSQSSASSSTNDPAYPAGPTGTPPNVGVTVQGTGESEFISVLASSAIAVGDVCQITAITAAAAPITTTNGLLGSQVGVAQVAIASGAWGWLQRKGACANINVAASCVQNVQLATTATAGVLDDAVTTGLKNVNGIVITTTVTGAATTAGTLNYPVVGTTN